MLFIIYITALTFIAYGLLCLLTSHMEQEFKRYGLLRFRTLTGVLELLGGLGLIIGTRFTSLLIFSSAGLTLLMFLGVLVRLKVKDPLYQILPAFSLMVLNGFICRAGLLQLG